MLQLHQMIGSASTTLLREGLAGLADDRTRRYRGDRHWTVLSPLCLRGRVSAHYEMGDQTEY
jgi:hypothetical protein